MTQRDDNRKGEKIIQVYEAQIKEHLREMVRGTVQETLKVLPYRI